jgi:hypothetical protein
MAGRIIAALRAIIATTMNVLVLPFRVFARLVGLSRRGRPGASRRSSRRDAA